MTRPKPDGCTIFAGIKSPTAKLATSDPSSWGRLALKARMGLMTVKSTPILMFLKGVATSTDTHCYFTIFIVEFVTTARTPAPVFALAIAGGE